METPLPLDQEGLKDKVPSLEDCFTSEFTQFIADQQKHFGLASGCLYNSCKEIEGEFMDLIEEISRNIDLKQKHWAIGPFNPVQMMEKTARHPCLDWLNKHETNSVVFVSFGTTTSLCDEQIKELAIGLEESQMKFVWVLRNADTGV